MDLETGGYSFTEFSWVNSIQRYVVMKINSSDKLSFSCSSLLDILLKSSLTSHILLLFIFILSGVSWHARM